MKKLFLCILGALLIFLPACERKNKGGEDATAPVKVEKKKLVIYNLFDPEDVFRGQIQAFESDFKGVDIEYKKFHNVEEYQKLILNELAEGRGPDIFAIRNDWLPNYQQKLTPAPISLYVPEKFSETFLAVASDDLIAPDEEEVDRIWGVPLYIDTLAIYYNKQLFRDNLPSTNKPGTTWTDIKEQVFGLTKANNSLERFAVSGMAMGYAANIGHFADILALLLIQEEAELFDDAQKKAVFAKSQGVNPGTGKAFFPAVEALKLHTSFALPSSRHTSWNLPITGLYPEQKEVGAFARGKVAMVFGFSSLYDEIKIAIDGFAKSNEKSIQMTDVGVAPAPQFAGSSDAGKQDALAKYYPFVVSRTTEHPDIAWALLEFLSHPDSLQVYHEKTNKPTSRLDMIEEQSQEEIFGVFARQASYAKSLQTLDPEAFYGIFATINDDIVKNRISVDQGVQKAEKQMTCILRKRITPEFDEDCFAL